MLGDDPVEHFAFFGRSGFNHFDQPRSHHAIRTHRVARRERIEVIQKPCGLGHPHPLRERAAPVTRFFEPLGIDPQKFVALLRIVGQCFQLHRPIVDERDVPTQSRQERRGENRLHARIGLPTERLAQISQPRHFVSAMQSQLAAQRQRGGLLRIRFQLFGDLGFDVAERREGD